MGSGFDGALVFMLWFTAPKKTYREGMNQVQHYSWGGGKSTEGKEQAERERDSPSITNGTMMKEQMETKFGVVVDTLENRPGLKRDFPVRLHSV